MLRLNKTNMLVLSLVQLKRLGHTARFLAKLADFGLASVEDSLSVTKMTKGAGTIDYTPPEVVGGLRKAAKSDVYSLGVTLFELYTGDRYWKRQVEDSQERVRWLDMLGVRTRICATF